MTRAPHHVLRRYVALLAVAALTGCSSAVDVTPPQPTGAAVASCRTLARHLPNHVSGEARRDTTPQSKLTAAWGDPTITLRCGVAKPKAYAPTAQLITVNGVDWLPVPQNASVPTRFYVVGRRAYIELVVPKEHAPASDALVDVGHAIKSYDPKDPSATP